MICFNCGQRYGITESPDESFCSKECEQEDTQRLIEGNGIVAKAEALSELNKFRLDVSGVIGKELGNLIHFGRNAGERSDPISAKAESYINEHQHSIEEIPDKI